MKNIDSDLIRGNIDTIILTTMLDGDKYGLDIIKEVETRSNGTYELKQPTLYSCLKRLENQELISSYWLDSDIGGRRHYYKLTEKGKDSLIQKQEEWTKSKFIIDNLLNNHNYDEYRLVKKEDYDRIIDGKQFEYNENQTTPPPIDQPATTIDDLDDFDESEVLNSDEDASNFNEDISSVDLDLENQFSDNIDEEPSSLDADIEEESDNYVFDETATVPEKHFDYGDDNDDAEKDYPNQKRFKIPSIYDKINIEESDVQEPFEQDDNEYEETRSIYNSLSEEEIDSTDEELSINDYIAEETDNEDEFVDDIINEYESYFNTPSEDEEFILGTDETSEDDDHVYIRSYDIDNNEEDDDLDVSLTNTRTDQAQNEMNILSRLRMQQNEEVNEYYGDKNSYINHLNKSDEIESLKSDDLNVVQEDLLSSNNYLSQSAINSKIDEFASAINKLNNFSFDSNENEENSYFEEDIEPETTIEEELISNSNSQEPSSEIIDFKNEPEDDDFLDELNALKQNENHGFFNSFDTAEYSQNKFIEPERQQSYNFENDSFEESDSSDASFEKQFENYNNQFGYNQKSTEETEDFSTYSFDNNTVSDDNNLSDDETATVNSFSSFDDIISKTADNYTSDTTSFMSSEEFRSFTPRYTGNDYKQKLNNLSAYSKVNNDEVVKQDIAPSEEVMNKVKDIQTLKCEFETEGILVKEYKKSNGHDDVDRNYLLVNKINLIKSLILLFGYVFVLSAVYIIMNNSSAQTIYGFSFKYFLFGFIPFAAYALYYAVMFVINPYKKIPAKYAPRIMIFISVIITIQLLLITYCVNLQLGFYSFSQTYYNHLFWVIPTIISFAPIVSNIIYMALYYSKNFNV